MIRSGALVRAVLVCYSLLSTGLFSFAQEERYCTAIMPCPVLNTPDFGLVFGGKDGKSIALDEKGFIRELEFIAFVGTTFEIIRQFHGQSHCMLEVRTPDYPAEIPLFIDSRFVRFDRESSPARKKVMMPAEQIIGSLRMLEGTPYLWGGNYAQGVDELLTWYPPSGAIAEYLHSLWRLEGVDCSGLIYQASGGFTPRNTSFMLDFGKGLGIEGLTAAEIAKKVNPLDLIVWPGHVVIVLDGETTIESVYPEGVVTSDLHARLSSIIAQRQPLDTWQPGDTTGFVIRRWHDEFFKD